MHDALVISKHHALRGQLILSLAQFRSLKPLASLLQLCQCSCRAESQVALQTRLANLQLQHVAVFDSECEGGLQQQAYLGNNEQLLQHMRDRGTISMTTKSVRNWLEKHGGFPLGYENANLCLADCDIDHILPNSVGGQNHPYNYVLLPKRLNGSFNGWWTAQKQVYIGKKTARTAKNFFIWVREEGSRLGLDCNDFHQKRYSM